MTLAYTGTFDDIFSPRNSSAIPIPNITGSVVTSPSTGATASMAGYQPAMRIVLAALGNRRLGSRGFIEAILAHRSLS